MLHKHGHRHGRCKLLHGLPGPGTALGGCSTQLLRWAFRSLLRRRQPQGAGGARSRRCGQPARDHSRAPPARAGCTNWMHATTGGAPPQSSSEEAATCRASDATRRSMRCTASSSFCCSAFLSAVRLPCRYADAGDNPRAAHRTRVQGHAQVTLAAADSAHQPLDVLVLGQRTPDLHRPCFLCMVGF